MSTNFSRPRLPSAIEILDPVLLCALIIAGQTRQYPWGIQQLVSTHPFSPCSWPKCLGGVLLATQNSKCQVLTKFAFGSVYSWQPKTQSPKSWSNFHFRGKGGILGNLIPKLCKSSRRSSNPAGVGRGVFFAKNRVFLAKWAKNSPSPTCCLWSQIVSNTLCMWRLKITQGHARVKKETFL